MRRNRALGDHQLLWRSGDWSARAPATPPPPALAPSVLSRRAPIPAPASRGASVSSLARARAIASSSPRARPEAIWSSAACSPKVARSGRSHRSSFCCSAGKRAGAQLLVQRIGRPRQLQRALGLRATGGQCCEPIEGVSYAVSFATLIPHLETADEPFPCLVRLSRRCPELAQQRRA